MTFMKSVRLDSFLSFPPDSPEFELRPLNLLIGPNGAGKSNFIEAFELLAATTDDFAAAVRDGGGAEEWPWKGTGGNGRARIEAVLAATPFERPLRYRLEFGANRRRVEVFDEALEETRPRSGYRDDVFFYYRFQDGHPALNVQDDSGGRTQRRLRRESLLPDQSVLKQRKDPDRYPEVTWVGEQFASIQTFREWSFGRYASVRQSQRADFPTDRLLPESQNLALVMNQVEGAAPERLNKLLAGFLPGFERIWTSVGSGRVELFLRESGLRTPIPATRLSDGTIRFMAIVATLLNPTPPPLVCIEEPELGLHPDATARLGELLIEASERTQLIVTTHSESLVGRFTNDCEAVIVCERPGAGTELQRLDRQELASWLDDYTLGDLWAMGQLGANP